jgi:HSP20 family protein
MAQEAKAHQPAESGKQGQQQIQRSAQGQGSRALQPFGRLDPFSFFPGEFFANPFGIIRRMHDEIDRLFAESFGPAGSQTGERPRGWVPALEISQSGDKMMVSAELPGLRPEDVHLEVTDDALIISGERQRAQESEEGGIRRSERHYGKFYRSIPMPEGVDTEKVQAHFAHGVLDVTIPVPQVQSRRHQIPIRTSETAGSTAAESAQKAGTATQS